MTVFCFFIVPFYGYYYILVDKQKLYLQCKRLWRNIFRNVEGPGRTYWSLCALQCRQTTEECWVYSSSWITLSYSYSSFVREGQVENTGTQSDFLLGYVNLVLLSDTKKLFKYKKKFFDCGSIQLGILYCPLQEINCSVLTDFFIIIIIINIIIVFIISIIRFQLFCALFSWGLWASKINIIKWLLSLLFVV